MVAFWRKAASDTCGIGGMISSVRADRDAYAGEGATPLFENDKRNSDRGGDRNPIATAMKAMAPPAFPHPGRKGEDGIVPVAPTKRKSYPTAARPASFRP